MHVELARAGPLPDTHRVVVLRRHIQDRADVVYVVFRHRVPATRAATKGLSKMTSARPFKLNRIASLAVQYHRLVSRGN